MCDMECLVMRSLGKNLIAVQLAGSGGVVSLLLPSDVDSRAFDVLGKANAFKPVKATVVLGDYNVDKYFFECKNIAVHSAESVSRVTTRYRWLNVDLKKKLQLF